jgi:hypothetical protein
MQPCRPERRNEPATELEQPAECGYALRSHAYQIPVTRGQRRPCARAAGTTPTGVACALCYASFAPSAVKKGAQHCTPSSYYSSSHKQRLARRSECPRQTHAAPDATTAALVNYLRKARTRAFAAARLVAPVVIQSLSLLAFSAVALHRLNQVQFRVGQ